MNTQDVINALMAVELSNTPYIDKETMNVKPERLPSLINSINLGLIQLYTRFLLKKEYETLLTYEDINHYTFNPENLIEILHIYNSLGEEQNTDGSSGIVKVSLKHLYFINPTDDSYMIQYRARHPKIYPDESEVELELPDIYLNALIYFVASRIFTSTTTSLDSNGNAQITNYTRLFEQECQRLLSQGVDINEDLPTNLFHQRGFV